MEIDKHFISLSPSFIDVTGYKFNICFPAIETMGPAPLGAVMPSEGLTVSQSGWLGTELSLKVALSVPL